MDPLRDAPPQQVPLAHQLRRVLCSVQFSRNLAINEQSGVGVTDFQKRIVGEYPRLTTEIEQGILFQLDGSGALQPMMQSNPVWRFSTLDNAWRVSLTQDTLAIDTGTAYTHRDEFVTRLKRVLLALQTVYQPAEAMRIGCRYINVLDGAARDNISELVRDEFAAFGGERFQSALRVSTNLSEFEVPEGNLIVRWGHLPPGSTHDPAVLDPEAVWRWFLDLDASYTIPESFDGDVLFRRALSLTERVYSMFRWAVKPKYLETHGAA